MTHQRSDSCHATHPIIAKWCIWSIEHQTWLAGRLRIYIWGATATVAFFAFEGFIKLETALWSMFFCGAVISAALWLLIRQRKLWLLHIQNPVLRQQALAAMITYLNSVNHAIPTHSFGRPIPKDGCQEQVDCPQPNVTVGENHVLQ